MNPEKRKTKATSRPTGSNGKGQKFPAEVLSDDEIRGLIRACSNRAPTGIRNRALIVLLYRGGLRISEALGLKPADVDRKAGTVRVLHGKGNKARTIGLDDGAMAVLDRWIDRRQQLGITTRRALFCTLDGGPVQAPYVRNLLPRLARKAGIEKRVHAHGLRHTHAAQLAAEGVPINVIQKQLGHANANVTAQYLDHIAPADVIATMKQREWEL